MENKRKIVPFLRDTILPCMRATAGLNKIVIPESRVFSDDNTGTERM